MQVSSRHTMRKEPKDRYHCFLYEDIAGKMRMAQVLFINQIRVFEFACFTVEGQCDNAMEISSLKTTKWCACFWFRVLSKMRDNFKMHLGCTSWAAIFYKKGKLLNNIFFQRNMSWENHGKWILVYEKVMEK